MAGNHDFIAESQPELMRRLRWELIPAEVDVLVTHGPPRGFGSTTRSELAPRYTRGAPSR